MNLFGKLNRQFALLAITVIALTNASTLMAQQPLKPYPFVIINKESGKVLDVRDRSTANGALVQQWQYGGGANQEWYVVWPRDKEKCYALVNRGSGKVLDLKDLDSNQRIIQQWIYNGGGDQLWKLFSGPGDYYNIASYQNNKYLDMPYKSRLNGTYVQLYKSNGGNNQQWLLIPLFHREKYEDFKKRVSLPNGL